MRLSSLGAMTFLSCVVALSHADVAQACGGCFHGVDESVPSVVTGHRMALSMSPTRTVLWDQVQYAGDPKDFAWVLPVGEGAYIEESTDAWFESLEAVSATRVMSPILVCNGREVRQQESGFGCGGSSASPSLQTKSTGLLGDGEPQRQGGVRGVSVEHEGTVGPYETVTLKSGDPLALRKWLTENGYAIPKEIDPVIDAYVAEGASFIALRLKPGVGVRQMTPVRVITPGASPILPLRMVAAGTGAAVSIVLYVIGEGRYSVQDKSMVELNRESLTWDWSLAQSNYTSLRDLALGGDAYMTSFALPKGFTSIINTPEETLAQYTINDTAMGTQETYDNLTDLYFGRASGNANDPSSCSDVDAFLGSLDPGALIVPQCDPDSPDCAPLAEGSFTSDKLDCGGFTDVSTALVGMHPADVWITRLEAELPRSALASDLTLEAAPSQAPVPNWHVAETNINPPCTPGDESNDSNNSASDALAPVDEEESASGCSMRKPLLSSATLGATSLFALLLVLRRATGKGRRRRSEHP